MLRCLTEEAMGETGKNQRMTCLGSQGGKAPRGGSELSFHQRPPWVRKDECSELLQTVMLAHLLKSGDQLVEAGPGCVWALFPVFHSAHA